MHIIYLASRRISAFLSTTVVSCTKTYSGSSSPTFSTTIAHTRSFGGRRVTLLVTNCSGSRILASVERSSTFGARSLLQPPLASALPGPQKGRHRRSRALSHPRPHVLQVASHGVPRRHSSQPSGSLKTHGRIQQSRSEADPAYRPNGKRSSRVRVSRTAVLGGSV